MSLLLDALKKAAKDKENASAKSADDTQIPADASDQRGRQDDADIELELEDAELEGAGQEASAAETRPADKQEDAELTLDASVAAARNYRSSPNTVSDEALQVLIYKTNHEHRRRHRIVWVSAILVSISVLIASGMYFYNQMQQEVAQLERRHQQNMRAVQTEPVKTSRELLQEQQPPPKAELKQVVRSAAVAEKPATTRPRPVTSTRTNAATRQAQSSPASAGVISIARGEKRDPISKQLSTAWHAYNKQDYAQARNVYEQVLAREKNNRDALMGMGAIALKYGDSTSARHYYNRLLQLDPRDAIANAAIINMDATIVDAMSESKLKTLLQQDPQAAQLHYALGNKYVAQSKWPEAQAAFFSAFENSNTNADYAYNLAVSLERINKPGEAAQYYEKAIQLAENSNISFSLEVVEKRLKQLKP